MDDNNDMQSGGDMKGKVCGGFGVLRGECERLLDTLRGPKACSRHNQNDYGRDLCVKKEWDQPGSHYRFFFPASGLARRANTLEHLKALKAKVHSKKEDSQKNPEEKPTGKIRMEPIILADTGFELRAYEEWVPVDMNSVPFGSDQGQHWGSIRWFYYLAIDGDQYTLYWSQADPKKPPKRKDPSVTFRLHDGLFPENLRFHVTGEWREGKPDYTISLKLK